MSEQEREQGTQSDDDAKPTGDDGAESGAESGGEGTGGEGSGGESSGE